MLQRLVPDWIVSPVRISMAFEDRPYKLGEPLHLVLELRPRRDVELAQGRVDLLCEERYAETYAWSETPPPVAGLLSRTSKSVPVDNVPRQKVMEFVNSFVHSTVVILEDVRLQGGSTARYDVKLGVHRELPPHAGGGTLTWTLAATVRTARGREVTKTQEAVIALK